MQNALIQLGPVLVLLSHLILPARRQKLNYQTSSHNHGLLLAISKQGVR